ncbi:SET domain-containing protein-lysine N-methyltransferase [Haliangium sp. UPWRP_2]|uniref:SET domain-containing protein n=1 Tax=Haliangium sp. UPWRP_2 TaxID=1931276 RepID=UPI000B540E52|nr:SET domain-containing protein-lysine N-methyltransferase [Haliangium sp. UPWRP_2]PSM32004.1 SET domain-containing protein [Haliangium sp. UPWRP_2]
MIEKAYPSVSWLDSRLVVKKSPIAQSGIFATENIKQGEVLIRWGGEVFTIQEVLDGATDDDTACQIDDEHYIAFAKGHGQDADDFMNHSCDPNTWMEDEVTISARRDIQAGEEITADYALWVAEDAEVLIPNCQCKTGLCRQRIMGDDWKLKSVQDRFRGHFPPYLERRISAHRNER